MWAALPDGALKRQLLGELASIGTLELAELSELWGNASAQKPAPRTGAPAVPRRQRGVRHGATNLLDRALWLLVHRIDSWGELDPASHDMLAEQAAPYGELFAGLERSLNDHGAQAPAAVLDELRQIARFAVAGEACAATVDRIAALHEPDPASDLQAELAIVLDRLRLQAIEEELKLLFESGELSPDAQRRGAELMRSQSQLKAAQVKRSTALL